MRLKIPKISHDEAISAFIKGLRFHEALRNKLLRKRPTTMAELLATAKNYADADDAEKLIRDDARGPDQTPR
jgi:LPS O-antigen subunit length determinant protein (WzzB/FepE family)